MNDLYEVCRRELYSAVIADGLDTVGEHHRALKPGVHPLDESLVLCGRARVGIYTPLYHDDKDVRVYENEIRFVDSLAKDDVAVLACHGLTRLSPWGELLSTRARYLGSAGCLTDGCVRDSRLIREMAFPVFASGTNPVDTKYRAKMTMYDVPGEIAGVRVESGDLIFGDIDGTVVVPKDLVEIVITHALEKVRSENTVREELAGGETLVNVFARHRIL